MFPVRFVLNQIDHMKSIGLRWFANELIGIYCMHCLQNYLNLCCIPSNAYLIQLRHTYNGCIGNNMNSYWNKNIFHIAMIWMLIRKEIRDHGVMSCNQCRERTIRWIWISGSYPLSRQAQAVFDWKHHGWWWLDYKQVEFISSCCSHWLFPVLRIMASYWKTIQWN